MKNMVMRTEEEARNEDMRCPCRAGGAPCGSATRAKTGETVTMRYASSKPDHQVEVVRLHRRCSGPQRHDFTVEFRRVVPIPAVPF